MFVERLQEDLKAAMKSGDQTRLRTIRSLRAAMMEREIAMRQGEKGVLPDEEAMTILQKQAKQRRDSIEQFKQANREDLAEKEQEELEIIETYLPQQLSEEEIRKAVSVIISQVGASGPGDMGRVMGEAMTRLKGKADGRMVQAAAKELLSGS